jgi:hypothetical protein
MGDSTTTRPAPAASGTFAKTPFLHLLVYALEKRLTGSIEIFSPDRRTATILFAEGQPAKVRTGEPVAYLGRILLEGGHLTDQQLTESLVDLAKAKAAGAMLHGALLIEKGRIDAATLRASLREQLARKLKYVAGMPSDSAYAYFSGFDALRGWGGEGDGVDPVPLFWGMLTEHAPWEHVAVALGRVASSPLRLTPGADLNRLRLKADELAAVRLLEARPMRPSELAKIAVLGDRMAQLLVYLLLVTKQVEVMASETVVTGAGDARESPPAVGSLPPPRVSTPAPSRKSNPAARSASGLSVPPPDVPADLALRWREISERAATIDRADYFMMLDLARDATREDVKSAFFALVKKWHPDRLPPELAPVRDACSRVFARMSEAHSTLADDEQRAKYMRLLADGSGSPETQATVAKVVEAATSFQKAEVCLRRNDLAQAEAFCRKAVEDDATQPDYLAVLAWLEALKNHSQEKTLESIQKLDRAIGMSGRCERAYFYRGMLYKRLGKNDPAVKDFKRAVDLNPRNIDAAREVRLHNMRGGGRPSKPPTVQRRTSPTPPKPDETPKAGILGRLFKKP